MGRHSRRGPADNGDTADIPVAPVAAGPAHPGPGTGRRRRTAAAAPGHTSARPGVPPVRGGHPEQREPGGGWGEPGGSGRSASDYSGSDRSRSDRSGSDGRGFTAQAGPPLVPRPRPRQEYVDAFGGGAGDDPYAAVSDWDDEAPPASAEAPPAQGGGKRGKGLTFTGIAAAAVTTVLAVIVAGQVTDGGSGSSGDVHAQSADGARADGDAASRSDDRATPSQTAQAAPATYEQKMSKKYPLAEKLQASGKFEAIPGFEKAPGRGEKIRYRIDVEKGLGLDGELFAQAVQKTLNDNRSWAHDGARTFERISSGKPQFVITLASPGTTAKWCKMSGLDTTEDNVSCDSAATDRVMINAYRWAQGSKTYDDVLGDRSMHPYRQMLINHEVGHRLGYNHVTCSQDGALAPVMQQQTKFLTFGGITCKPNPWVYPKG
ncbi:DUF3152 domain-containing protein [Streptomyces sp. NPDC050085]|uniref:DUF3152 domain-containing protein n=1 Tax=Streptomyces sp. NPDC050085 TaxID=3365600 RepID=UPI00378BE039